MKRIVTRFSPPVLLFFLLTLFGACKSAPPPAENPPEAAPQAVPATPPAPSDGAADRSRALEAMEKAKSVKADVAVKDLFDAARKALDEGDARTAEDGAPQKYREAEEGFLAAYESALAKREEALRQLDLAREAVRLAEEETAAYDEAQ